MTEKLQQKMKTEIAKLPKEKQDAINAVEWGKISEEIGKKYKLSENEINELQLETGLVLLGLVEFNIYKLNVENIGLTKDETEKIVMEVLEKIFTPVATIIESSIKNAMKNQNINWNQRVNFIISGGDYSNFMEK